MKNKVTFIFFIIINTLAAYAQNNEANLKIFDNPPDTVPKIFAKELISIADRYEYGLAISPDYNEIFFTAVKPGDGLMFTRKLDDDSWSTPKTANLRGNNSDEQEAFFTPDGQKLYFASDVNDTTRLWVSLKENSKWSLPILLDSPVNNTRVFWATFTNNNTMYYSNLSNFKIYKSKLENNQYKATENAGIPFGMHPSVSKDESFILFNFRGDIYVAFKNNENVWGKPRKLEGLINTTEFSETCPSFSPDEKFIFFSRYNDLNKKSDIYWINSIIIEKTRKKFIK
ncbi:MAG: PD40 domain-containing protein [Marinifilaceae bacterium]|nr:PD40 domain-containing protein [Marinifilaceae bacterium]